MIKIKNLKEEQPEKYWDVRIDRSSIFGNPFKIGSDGTRDDVCNFYELFFKQSIEKSLVFEAEVNRLINKYTTFGRLNLFCWCSPLRCHGDAIKKYIESTVSRQEQLDRR